MSLKWIALGILGVFVILILGVIGFFVGTYNSIVELEQGVDAQWANVESKYQRRFDLIPNLVATVKGVTKQEFEVFSAIAEARTRYSGAASVDEKAAAASQVESALSRLLVIVENYPELRSSESFLALMAELSGTENRISVERDRFNNAVREYNVKIKQFPSNVVASMFNFKEKQFFEAVKGAETAPQVDFT